MPNASPNDGQPISRAEQVLRQPSDNEALELDRQDEFHFPRVDRTPNPRHGKFRQQLARLWNRHVSLGVPHELCRDHLANERTFLGYLRTSQVCSMMGVFVAQFFRLRHSASPDQVLGFYVVGIPLSSIFQILAVLVLLIGAARFFKMQQTMALGKVIAGGWEVLTVGGLSAAMLLTLSVLVLAITVDKA